MEKTYKVTTNSMFFLLEAGDDVSVEFCNIDSIKPGDIALLVKWSGNRPADYVIHRVVFKYRNKLITKGDVNLLPDLPLKNYQLIGRVKYIRKNFNNKIYPVENVFLNRYPFFCSFLSLLLYNILTFFMFISYNFVYLVNFITAGRFYNYTNFCFEFIEKKIYFPFIEIIQRLFYYKSQSANVDLSFNSNIKTGRIYRNETWNGEITVYNNLIIMPSVKINAKDSKITFKTTTKKLFPFIRLFFLKQLINSRKAKIINYGRIKFGGERFSYLNFEDSDGIYSFSGSRILFSKVFFYNSPSNALSCINSKYLYLNGALFIENKNSLTLLNVPFVKILNARFKKNYQHILAYNIKRILIKFIRFYGRDSIFNISKIKEIILSRISFYGLKKAVIKNVKRVFFNSGEFKRIFPDNSSFSFINIRILKLHDLKGIANFIFENINFADICSVEKIKNLSVKNAKFVRFYKIEDIDVLKLKNIKKSLIYFSNISFSKIKNVKRILFKNCLFKNSELFSDTIYMFILRKSAFQNHDASFSNINFFCADEIDGSDSEIKFFGVKKVTIKNIKSYLNFIFNRVNKIFISEINFSYLNSEKPVFSFINSGEVIFERFKFTYLKILVTLNKVNKIKFLNGIIKNNSEKLIYSSFCKKLKFKNVNVKNSGYLFYGKFKKVFLKKSIILSLNYPYYYSNRSVIVSENTSLNGRNILVYKHAQSYFKKYLIYLRDFLFLLSEKLGFLFVFHVIYILPLILFRFLFSKIAEIFVYRSYKTEKFLPLVSDLDVIFLLKKFFDSFSFYFLNAFYFFKRVFPFLGEIIVSDRKKFLPFINNWGKKGKEFLTLYPEFDKNLNLNCDKIANYTEGLYSYIFYTDNYFYQKNEKIKKRNLLKFKKDISDYFLEFISDNASFWDVYGKVNKKSYENNFSFIHFRKFKLINSFSYDIEKIEKFDSRILLFSYLSDRTFFILPDDFTFEKFENFLSYLRNIDLKFINKRFLFISRSFFINTFLYIPYRNNPFIYKIFDKKHQIHSDLIEGIYVSNFKISFNSNFRVKEESVLFAVLHFVNTWSYFFMTRDIYSVSYLYTRLFGLRLYLEKGIIANMENVYELEDLVYKHLDSDVISWKDFYEYGFSKLNFDFIIKNIKYICKYANLRYNTDI